jgi:hypothetical protein
LYKVPERRTALLGKLYRLTEPKGGIELNSEIAKFMAKDIIVGSNSSPSNSLLLDA